MDEKTFSPSGGGAGRLRRMFGRLFDRLSRLDSALSLLDWLWLGFRLFFGVTGATVTAYLFAQVNWYWDTLGWAGVALVAIASFFVISLSLALLQFRRPSPRARAGKPSLSLSPQDDTIQEKARSVLLSADQVQCRVALKQFALAWPAQLHNAASRVRAVVLNKIKQNGEKDYAFALHHALHEAYSSGNKHLPIVTDLAGADLERIDVDGLTLALLDFFGEYVWEQRLIANLNVIVKVNLAPLPEVQRWLEIDRNCLSELTKLQIWPEAAKLRTLTDGDKMASNSANWTMPRDMPPTRARCRGSSLAHCASPTSRAPSTN